MAILLLLITESSTYALFVAVDLQAILGIKHSWMFSIFDLLTFSGSRLTIIAIGFLYFKEARDPLAGA